MSKNPPQSPSPEEKAKQIYHTWFCKDDSKEDLPRLYRNLLGKTYPCSQNEEYGQVKEWEIALLRDLVMPLQEELRKEQLCDGISSEDLFCLSLGNAALEKIDRLGDGTFGEYPKHTARGRNRTLFNELRKWFNNNSKLGRRVASMSRIDWMGGAGGRLFVLALYWATREQDVVEEFNRLLGEDIDCDFGGGEDDEERGIDIECVRWMIRWHADVVRN